MRARRMLPARAGYGPITRQWQHLPAIGLRAVVSQMGKLIYLEMTKKGSNR